MSNLSNTAHFADHAVQVTTPLVENVCLARDTYRVRVECPELARRILPGQFVMIRFAEGSDPLLGRPLAVYDTVMGTDTAMDTSADTDSVLSVPTSIDLVFVAVGKFTRQLAKAPVGQKVKVWGPLGNGFAPQATDHLVMVAGGIGQTPFLSLAREALGKRRYGNDDSPREVSSVSPKVTLCYGAKSAEFLAGVEDFEQLGVDVRISTDDGSRGHHGLVTDLLRQVLEESKGAQTSPRIVTCGPEPMLKAVCKVAAEREVPCQVSLETPMACGIGICFSCVCKIRDGENGWDYKRSCVEGPVFDAKDIVW